MTDHRIGTRQDWERARVELLAKEKELTRQADALARERRALPWVRVDTEYTFDTEDGRRSLADLFGDRSQLLVYHFMFAPDWEEGCVSCSFWADNLDGIDRHLAARDVAFTAASAAPLETLLGYRRRMGWSFPWVSTAGTTFNRDFEVSGTTRYNFRETDDPIGESPGLSAFALDDGVVYHTYSVYGRGLESFNGAYHLLDLTPRGRDEDGLEWSMAWLRRHDSYA